MPRLFSGLNLPKKLLVTVLLFALLGTLSYLFIPKPELLFYQTYSRAVFDRNDQLLRIVLAQDERYRLYTPLEDISEHLQETTILYEDQHFYQHSGVDFGALIRAFWQTYVLQERRIGASTIVMQVARLRWNISSNTVLGKISQVFRAIQLARHYSKDALLEAYLNLAPYGGNVEGIGAASLIYFNKPAAALSLAEAMALALVPQNPSKRNPSKESGRREIELAKPRLQARWLHEHPNDQQLLSLNDITLKFRAIQDLPFKAPHFVQYLLSQAGTGYPTIGATNSTKITPPNKAQLLRNKQQITGTVDLYLQTRLEKVLQAYIKQNKNVGFSNASALLLNHKTMHIKAMIGSANFLNSNIHGQVNGTLAKRSPGSTLKPFVYALAIDAGLIHPMTMLKDLPKKYAGFAPENFGKGFVGPISAQAALINSRNVPAVDLQYQLNELKSVNSSNEASNNVQTFYEFLQNTGVSELKDPSFYGLALALGGGELTMLELVKLYAVLPNLGIYKDAVSTHFESAAIEPAEHKVLSPEAAFLVYDMLRKNPRPRASAALAAFSNQARESKVAWKTGTSWAFRDAWAIGIAGDYVMAVWVGNFDGPGNNSFIGRTAAGPLLFTMLDIVIQQDDTKKSQEKLLPEWFQDTPFTIAQLQKLRLKQIEICKTSGDLFEPNCPEKSTTLFIPGVSPIKSANIYRKVNIDKLTGYRQCQPNLNNARQKVFAFWPSDFQRLFAQAGIHIEKPPKYAPSCKLNEIALLGKKPIINSPHFAFTYIVQDTLKNTVSIPLQASADAETSFLYWFANEHYIGREDLANNSQSEPLIWEAKPGKYELMVSDDLGRSAQIRVIVNVLE